MALDDLDTELLRHLPDAEAWLILRAEGFRADLIEDEEYREIYVWADDQYHKYGSVPTEDIFDEEFPHFKDESPFFEEPTTSVGYLIERMRERYMSNVGRQKMKVVAKKFIEDPMKALPALANATQELQELLARRGEMYGNGDFDRMIKRYHDRAAAGAGPSFGFEEIDDFFYGQRGVSVLLGPPKTYKSWHIIKAFQQNIAEGKYPWLYPLELPAEETKARLLCLTSGVPWWKYLRGALSNMDEKAMAEAENVLDGNGAYKIVKPPEKERSIDVMITRAQDAGAGVVFIDQLQYVEIDGKSLFEWNETGKYGGVLNRARNYSDDTPICIAHQFNRSTMNNDSMPVVEQAKGSNAIAEVSTLVLGIWASKEMKKSMRMEIGTLAARNHGFRNWEVGIDLTEDCRFDILGVVEDG